MWYNIRKDLFLNIEIGDVICIYQFRICLVCSIILVEIEHNLQIRDVVDAVVNMKNRIIILQKRTRPLFCIWLYPTKQC